MSVEKAVADYIAFHWGLEPDEIYEIESDKHKGPLYMIGYLPLISYLTQKDGDDDYVLYEHDFRTPWPILCVDADGELVILGGNYTVQDRGIVG